MDKWNPASNLQIKKIDLGKPVSNEELLKKTKEIEERLNNI